MPATPDFDALALRIAGYFDAALASTPVLLNPHAHAIKTHLQQVWNARGVADLAAIETLELTTPLSMQAINRTLRTVDR